MLYSLLDLDLAIASQKTKLYLFCNKLKFVFLKNVFGAPIVLNNRRVDYVVYLFLLNVTCT